MKKIIMPPHRNPISQIVAFVTGFLSGLLTCSTVKKTVYWEVQERRAEKPENEETEQY